MRPNDDSSEITNSTIKSTTKGFLFKILTQDQELVGYFFGTHHHLAFDKLEQLDPSILACFDNSTHLFQEIADLEININELPEGVDAYLKARAINQNKPVYGLETENSRKKISDIVHKNEEISYFYTKIEAIMIFTFGELFIHYNELIKLMENASDLIDVTEKLKNCIKLIYNIIDNRRFLPPQLQNKFCQIFEQIIRVLNSFELHEEGSFLRNKLTMQIKSDELELLGENNGRDQDQVMQWYMGGVIPPRNNEPEFVNEFKLDKDIKKFINKLNTIELQARDAVMAEVMHQDLLLSASSQGKRCGFYAPGAFHVIGDYPKSLPKLLKQKKWILIKIEPYQISAASSISHQSTQQKLYIIPDFNQDKKLLVTTTLGGQVEAILIDSAKIRVEGRLLTKAIREQLGLERFKITLPTDKSKRLEYLKERCEATVEREATGQYLITFPSKHKRLVEEVIFHWDKLQLKDPLFRFLHEQDHEFLNRVNP